MYTFHWFSRQHSSTSDKEKIRHIRYVNDDWPAYISGMLLRPIHMHNCQKYRYHWHCCKSHHRDSDTSTRNQRQTSQQDTLQHLSVLQLTSSGAVHKPRQQQQQKSTIKYNLFACKTICSLANAIEMSLLFIWGSYYLTARPSQLNKPEALTHRLLTHSWIFSAAAGFKF